MSDSPQPTQEWRWPNHIAMSPSSLKAYDQCPFRVKMQYLQNLEPPDKWVHHFALGNATHSALGTIAQQLKAGVKPIGEDQIRVLCRFHMPESEYPSPEAREYDIQQVLEWVRRGRAWLETLNVEDWLVIEQKRRRDVTLFPAQAPYELLTKPDLIVKRLDEDGQPYFQIIDWKTGSVYEEPDVPVIVRYAIRTELQKWTGNATAASVVFTWFWLKENYRKDFDVSAEHCNDHWPSILGQMEALAKESEWIATPGWYCNYCKYYQNYCPEEIPPADDP
jgi:hypothetical protein